MTDDHDAEMDAFAMVDESGVAEEYDQVDGKPRCGFVVLARSVGGGHQRPRLAAEGQQVLLGLAARVRGIASMPRMAAVLALTADDVDALRPDGAVAALRGTRRSRLVRPGRRQTQVRLGRTHPLIRRVAAQRATLTSLEASRPSRSLTRRSPRSAHREGSDAALSGLRDPEACRRRARSSSVRAATSANWRGQSVAFSASRRMGSSPSRRRNTMSPGLLARQASSAFDVRLA
jgi:hypothetical protein